MPIARVRVAQIVDAVRVPEVPAGARIARCAVVASVALTGSVGRLAHAVARAGDLVTEVLLVTQGAEPSAVAGADSGAGGVAARSVNARAGVAWVAAHAHAVQFATGLPRFARDA